MCTEFFEYFKYIDFEFGKNHKLKIIIMEFVFYVESLANCKQNISKKAQVQQL